MIYNRLEAAALQLGQHPQPLLGALAAMPAGDLAVPDLDVAAVDGHDGIDGIEWAIPPLGRASHYRVGDRGVIADLDSSAP